MTIKEADFIGSMNMCDEISNEAYKKIMCNCEVEEKKPSEDCIRREAVMKCFKKWQPYMATRLWDYEQELKDLPSITPQPRWIPCSERLPQDEQKVLVTTRSGKFIDVTTSIYHHASAYWEHYVIAWMPLPEPYTESEDKE